MLFYSVTYQEYSSQGYLPENCITTTTTTTTTKIVTMTIMLLVYKGLNGLAPTYIADLLSYRKYIRALRSASQSFLKITRMNTKSYGDRAFSVSGPKLRNGLPLQIRESRNINSFKTALKTHLFREANSL